MKNSVLTVRIPADLRRDLDEILKDENIPLSDFIRESLERYLAMKRFRRLRKTAIKKFSDKGIYTEKDVFRLIS
jgi:metal-responsive CopG/Arc/MetJ family transcriptional regulator